MTNKVKSGLIFGFGMAFIYLSKPIIAWITGEEETTREIVESVIAAIIAGLVSGTVYGWLSDKYVIGSIFTKPANFSPDTGEVIIFKTFANHFIGAECFGGTLYLTDKRLVFKPNNPNNKNSELSIPLADLTAVERYKMHGFMNCGLKVRAGNSLTEKFVVEKPGQWPEFIENARHGSLPGTVSPN
jgi:GRAM domain